MEKDSGASIRDGVKVLHKLGVCEEKDCPYDINRFSIQPSTTAYIDAQKHKSLKYRKVKQDNSIFSSLTMGYPLIFGFSVYESFEDPEGVAKTGTMTLPTSEEKLLGGHAVLLCGYKINGNRAKDIKFLVRNSWGNDWGMRGYFWMEYSYLMNPNLCSDFWTIEKITNPTPTSQKPYKIYC